MTKENQSNNQSTVYNAKKLHFAKPLSFGVLNIIKPVDKHEVNQFNKRYGSILASF